MLLKKSLDIKEARAITAKCEEYAIEIDKKVTIAIVDEGGHLILLTRMDGAPPISVEIALGKSRTAAMARKSSRVYMERIAKGENAVLSLPGLTCMEGGVPVSYERMCVGAVGVSGAESTEDAMIADAGIKALFKTFAKDKA